MVTAKVIMKPGKEKAQLVQRPHRYNDEFIEPVMKYLSDKWSEFEIKERLAFLKGWRKLSQEDKYVFLATTLGFKRSQSDLVEMRKIIDEIDKLSYRVVSLTLSLDSRGIPY
jgi:hypothetical protein